MGGATSGETVGALIESLKKALAAGDVASAKEVAGNLAQLKVKTNMIVESVGDIPPGRPGTIRLNVNVEDRVETGVKIILTVRPNDTIAALKRKMFHEYTFPVQAQRWIMGRRIPKDFETLLENGIGISGANCYLYLVSAEKVGVTKRQAELERQSLNHPATPQNPPGLDRAIPAPVYPPYVEPQQTYLQPRPEAYQPQSAGYTTLPPPRTRIPSGGDNGGYMRMDPRPRRPTPAPTPPKRPAKPTADEVGWHCPACTLINPPTFPGCSMCSTERPADYQVPPEGSYIMDADEKRRYEDVRRNEQLMQQLEQDWEREANEEAAANFQRILDTEGQELITNTEDFECLICYTDVAPGEGVVLRDCLHTFCKECLGEHIKASEEPVVMCPYQDGLYSCPEAITEREIKALVTPAEFKKHLDRGLTTAESQAANSFHCKTPDCPSFCFFDDNNNFFPCPVCGKQNCLTCKAIHEGMNCKQYQDDLKRRATNDDAARKTQEALDTMVRDGEAMKCPKCGIIVQKKDGCDWIRCTMCKVEICWVTRGLRWGPGGQGDISGGCRCRVGGVRCHVNCTNCH
ncbi:ranBP-type and C3HC4-type zinc finger-containing protein 1-like isoform X2 [Amphiura filiformis]|uniref:ranBP-type and C3HC4-type zinc finger-containing protein 1-like isoform X2 n=1 Tax=Amphiura filiformis TaxID=82378 RepID=UPI003B2203C1